MRRLIASLLIALSFPVLVAVPAAGAWSPFGGVDCSKAPNSAVCADKDNTNNPLLPSPGDKGIIMKVVDILAIIAGIAAVIMIIVAGLGFVQANGNPEAITGARRTIIYSLVGVVVIILGRELIFLVMSRL